MRLALFLLATIAYAQPRPSFSEPSLNPTRDEIAFVSGGDIWTVPVSGGEARLLVSHPASESRPHFSPDGKMLAFTSTRTGAGNVYVLDIAGGKLRRLTFDDVPESVDSWSPDGKYVYFTTPAKDIASETDIFRVSVDGGTPMPVAADRYVPEFFAAAGPTDGTIAFCAKGGMAYGQWWRHGHSHIDESEIWTKRGDKYEKLSGGPGARELWPMWSSDAKKVYFVSDRSGSENIWEKTPGGSGAERQITQFKDGRLLWPQLGGKRIAFERDFQIWTLDLASSKSVPVAISLRGSPAAPSISHMNQTNFRELSVSPDGKKLAVIAHGEVFAASSKDGGNAFRVTHTPASERDLIWAPDSKSVVYSSLRGDRSSLFQFDFVKNTETQLTSGGVDYDPHFSPDGKKLAFFRGMNELHTLELEGRKDHVVATGIYDVPPMNDGDALAWSPDSKWIAYLSGAAKFGLTNAFVAPADGSSPARAVSFLSNANASSLQWSPSGRYLLFVSSQRTENPLLARVDLTSQTPKFREDEFMDLFKEKPAGDKKQPAEKADKPAAEPKVESVKIEFDAIRRRLSAVPVGLDARSIRISPDGKTLLFEAVVGDQQNLYSYSLDELAKEPPTARQLTSTSGRKSSAQFTSDSKDVFYLEDGRIHSINVENRQVKNVAVTAEMDVAFPEEKMQVFEEAWADLRDLFYDPAFHGVDWNAEKKHYEPIIAGSQTPDEMRRAINLMIGDLNASHSGISGPRGGGGGTAAKLGLHFDANEFEAKGRLKVTEVLALSPAAIAGILPGEAIVAVDQTAITAHANLDELLEHKTGKRVVLSIANGKDDHRDVTVSPISTTTERRLRYLQWTENRRDLVSRASNGRLGYVHMPDMGSDSLTKLFLDLDAENRTKDGVVIDIRNNNGGFVNAYAIDVFARRGYLNMTPRGYPGPSSARTQLGQRSLEKPTILVTDMHSLSDAEDFSEGYHSLKIGKVVGEPTAGWIIFTGGTALLDGSNLRLPFVRITTNEGVNMEGHPRPVDVPVVRPVGEYAAGTDVQLETAVRELLAQIDHK